MFRPPLFFKSRIALVVVIVAAVVWGFGVPWWQTPREPVYQGKKLSWWFDHEPRLTRDQLRTLGPGAVAWLAYQVANSESWDEEDLPHNASVFRRYELRLREKLGDERLFKAEHVHFGAIVTLGDMGEDAAPAIPALIKAVGDGSNDSRLVAAEVLAAMGPVSWPAISEAIRHDTSVRRRITLLDKLESRWQEETAPPLEAAELVQIVALLVSEFHDPNPDVRDYAVTAFEKCAQEWGDYPPFDDGIRAGVEELPRLSNEELRLATYGLNSFAVEDYTTAAVPALTALADTPDEITRACIAAALAVLDRDNPRWPAVLQDFTHSKNEELADFAKRALIHAGR